jgi:AcrR family transcriptional regulator
MADNRINSIRHLSNNEANRITRESICTAFLELLQAKEFKEISISELVRRAGVSRQSFYRNYKTKEDVFFEIENTITINLTDKMKDPEYINNPRKWFLDYFSIIRENNSVVSLMQKADLFVDFLAKIPFYVESQVNSSGTEFHYNIVGSMGAVHAIAMDWFINGMKETDTEMADICMNYVILTKKSLKHDQ